MSLLDLVADCLSGIKSLIPHVQNIPAWEAGVVSTGEKVREIGPGWRVWWPIKTTLETCSTALDVLVAGPVTVPTKDDIQISASATVTYYVSDPLTFLSEINDAEGNIEDALACCLKEAICSLRWEEITKNLEEVDAHLLVSAAAIMEPFGVTVDACRVRSLAKSRSLTLNNE